VPVASLGLTWGRSVGDLDRDGSAIWLGERDCAPWDAKKSPLAVEIPGNDRDEDCDGKDAPAGAKRGPRLLGRVSGVQSRKYNIAWIVIDGVRPDRLGAYGSELRLTPNIDAFAAESSIFTRAFSQSTSTVFSFSSMLTGASPLALDWTVSQGRPQLAPRHLTLAERLAPLGYRSAIFLTDWTQKTYTGLQQGYDERITTTEIDVKSWFWTQHTSGYVTAKAVEFIERAQRRGQPFFGTFYYHDTHFPYVRHPDEPDPGTSEEALYNGELAFVDKNLGFLLDYLRYRSGLWNDTIVIISTDHGEEFSEHGRLHHARTCYVETTHVPLLIRIPGLEPRRVSAPVALVDIVPTLLELIGKQATAGPKLDELEGTSLLVPLLEPQATETERPIDCAVSSQWRGDERFFEASLRQGNWTLISDFKTGRSELYDTRADPGEQRNLAKDPAQAGRIASMTESLRQRRTGNLSDTLTAR
jgi:arylsulfatase A-like enzyme